MPESKPIAWTGIREPAVAGKFYSDNQQQLKSAINYFLEDAVSPKTSKPLAIISPHAGYIYSGQIAADAFNQARPHNYDLVIILGTNHTTAGFNKVSVFAGNGYRTPLGVAEIDKELVEKLINSDPDFVFNPRVHQSEHSVEVEVPFVQALFPGTRILTAVIGQPDVKLCEKFGNKIAELAANRNFLIVASTDLSHYPSYQDARQADHKTLKAITSMDINNIRNVINETSKSRTSNLSTCACGEGPVFAAIAAARRLGANCGTLISYANSGDIPVSDRKRVVGYGAVVFSNEEECPPGSTVPEKISNNSELNDNHKKSLLQLARRSIRQFLETETIPLARSQDPVLLRKQGAFVTIKKSGHLRGCIGHMAEDMPLCETVRSMALSAAFADHRFSPLKIEEYEQIEIEISVLTPARPIESAEQIELGNDGVILNKNGKRAVYLPQVAVEQGWDTAEMLQHLSQKAGLPPDAWKSAQLSVFQAIVFSESDWN